MIENIQNISNLCISLSVIVFGSSYIIPLIFAHCLADIFVCKTDIKIHHFFVLLFIVTRYITVQIPYPDESTIISTLLNTEISTLFYVLNIYLEKNIKRPAIGDQRSETSDRRPAIGDQRSETSDRRPAIGNLYQQNSLYYNLCLLPTIQIL